VLEAIGLSAGEERVYRVVVGAYRSSAGEIAGRLGLATCDVEPLLRALLSRRIVSRIGDDYLATPPAVTLGPLLVQGQAELERAPAAVTQTSEYRSNVRLRDSTRLVEVFTGAEVIREQALRLRRDVREAWRACKLGWLDDQPAGGPLHGTRTQRPMGSAHRVG
jgi:hypothetical protein